MNDSKKALLIFGGLAAVVVIVVGVMMSKTAFWLVGLLALLGIIIAAAAASDGSQKSDAPLREDEILDPDERFGFAFAVKVVGVSFPNDDPKAPHRQAVLREAFKGGGVLDDDPDSRYVPGALRRYSYQGQPALHVVTQYGCIGNIGRDDLPEILPLMPDVRVIVRVHSNDFDDRQLYSAVANIFTAETEADAD